MVAEDRAAEFAGAGPLLVVPDVLDAMRRLGIAARRRSDAMIVAVTGSVGKTGTKEAMRLAFERLGPTHASVASYNNHWGVPLTLARMPRDAAYGVFEIGMNHAGEIEPLTRMVRPHVAVITTVEPVHIEFFRSISAIADAKGEIFCGLEPGGDRGAQSRQRRTSSACALMRSPRRPAASSASASTRSADVRAERIILKPDLSIVEARVLGEPLVYRRRRARPARGHELARRARRREGRSAATSRSRRSASPTFSRRSGAASASALRRRRRLPPRRRDLQRQPGLDARRACESRRDRASARAGAASRSSATCSSSEPQGPAHAPRARAGGRSRAAPTSSSPPAR